MLQKAEVVVRTSRYRTESWNSGSGTPTRRITRTSAASPATFTMAKMAEEVVAEAEDVAVIIIEAAEMLVATL